MPENPEIPADASRQSPAGGNLSDPESAIGQRPPSGPGRLRFVGTALSCLMILAAIVASQISRDRQQQQTEQNVAPDTALQLTGRYAVGMKSLLGTGLVLERNIPQLKKALETSNNPRKQLFFAPILMELAAREDAIKELELLADRPAGDPVARDADLFLQLYQRGSDSLTAEQTRAIERFGWIGKLALSYDKAASDPARRAVVQSAIRTFIVSVAFIFLVIAALAAGSILFITAIVLYAKKRLRARLALPDVPGDSLLEAFALFLAGLVALPALARYLLPSLTTAATLFTVPIIAIALFWPFIRGAKGKDVRMAIGWHRGAGVLREMGAGIVGYLAGLPLLALGIIPVLLLSRSTGTVPTHPIVNEISSDPVSIIFIMGLACLWAPVVEETFFRGTLYGYLRHRWHWAVSGVASGLLFASMHPQGWIAVPLLGSIGFTLSAIREWRASIIASMTAHALNNGVVLCITILMLT
jgi:membrane protease YdiL (CAAX protease family)